jgi:hypothetical protein
MRTLIKISVLILICAFFSCEDQGLVVNCQDCVDFFPGDTNLEVKTDAGNAGFETQINVYEGYIEDSVLYSTYMTLGTHISIPVKVNKKYTVTATYFYKPDNYYTAIDAATPRVKFEKSQCDKPCYFVYDKDIDLRLKYTD